MRCRWVEYPDQAPGRGRYNGRHTLKLRSNEHSLREFYVALYRAWGRQHWWPARTRFEVVVGAYLTQNTAWINVERALHNLRAAAVLNLQGIRNTPLPQLESMIHPAGYFRQKAQRLKTFVAFLDQRYGGSLHRMFRQPTEMLREELLALHGVGPETADSILLYAGQHPVFVVDAYTRRILDRHRILAADAPYEEIRKLVEYALAPIGSREHASLEARGSKRETGYRNLAHPPSPMSRAQRSPIAQVFNDMHGLIVAVGKHHCLKASAHCDGCPLQQFLPGLK